MAALTNTQISVTYVGLLKTSANTVLSSSGQQITDGEGNNSILFLSTAGVGIGGAASSGKELDVTGNVLVTGDLQVDNINIDGNTISATSGVVTLANGAIATTQSQGDNSTKLATTAYVDTLGGTFLPLAGGTMSGNIAMGSNNISGGATFTATTFSGQLSGTINSATTATTQSQNDNSTKIATTSYVDTAINAIDTLAEILAIGNTTGATKIEVDNTSGGVDFIDNAKARFGTGDDLQIYHSGTNSVIDNNTNSLFITTASQTIFESDATNNQVTLGHTTGNWFLKATNSNTLIIGSESNATNNITLDTTNGGSATFAGAVEVNGNLVVDGAGTSTDFQLRRSANAAALLTINAPGGTPNGSVFSINGNSVMTLDENQNSTFAGNITISKDVPVLFLTDTNSDSDYSIKNNDGVFDIRDETNGTNRLRIGSDGSVNIYNNTTFAGNVTLDTGLMLVKSASSSDTYQGLSTGTSSFIILANSGGNAFAGSTNGSYVIYSGGNASSTTGAGASLALTLDSSQNATFAGNVKSNSTTAFSVGTVGNIGNTAGDVNIYSSSSGHNGLRMHANGILPTDNAGTIIDNDADLGFPTYRFKDLYLGGSITSGGGATFAGNVGIGVSPVSTLSIQNSQSTAANNTTTGSIFQALSPNSGIFMRNRGASAGIGGANYSTQLFTDSGAGNFEIYNIASTSDLVFGTNATERMRIDSSGNLGLGTASPSKKLHVYNTAAADVALLESTQAFSTLAFKSSSNTDTAVFGVDGGGNAYIENKKSTHPILFTTNSSERMRITSGGEILFGTTGTPNGTSVYGSGFIPVSTGKVALRMASSSTSAGTLIEFFNPNGTVGNITISASATAFNTSSDYRLKEDLQDFAGLDMVSKIPVYDFKWKADENRSYGVMAHELEEVLPQAVNGEKDAEEMQSVDYSKIVPLLVKSIQELKKEIEILKSK